MRTPRCSVPVRGLITFVLGTTLLMASVQAQMPTYDPMQGMPPQGMPMDAMPMDGMPTQGMPMQGMPMQGMPMHGQGMPNQDISAMKHAFAATIATVLHGTGSSLATTLVQGLAGTIQGWFQRRNQRQQSAQAAPVNPSGMAPNMDPMAAAAGPTFAAQPATLYAGMAYEVHALAANGSSRPVDPESHTFGTGERFVVLYRPTLPGRIAVYNINPYGQETRIDDLSVAAGDLARMGPYEFRDQAGDEILKLILTPCRSDQLLATTRSIVKVEEYGGATGMNDWSGGTGPGSMSFSECGAVTSRSAGASTRSIARVEMDGSTLFALDAVTPQEMSTGRYESREITIRFRHR